MTVTYTLAVWCGGDLHQLVVEAGGRPVARAHQGPPPDDGGCARAVALLSAAVSAGTEVPASVAATVFRLRQERLSHPTGQRDDGGRWWPEDQEWRPCCDEVRAPSRNWPRSLMDHCRTAKHVAALFGVEASAMRAASKVFAPR